MWTPSEVHVWNTRRTEHMAVPLLRDFDRRWVQAWKIQRFGILPPTARCPCNGTWNLLRKSYELKCLGIIGDQPQDKKEIHFLNRLIRCGENEGRPAAWIEPDRRHVDLLIQSFGMTNAKGVESPDVKKSADQQALETRSPLLPKEAASEFRSAVMRAAYLSQDRPDIGHAVKNLARRRSADRG